MCLLQIKLHYIYLLLITEYNWSAEESDRLSTLYDVGGIFGGAIGGIISVSSYFTHTTFCLLMCTYKYIDSVGSTGEAISCCDSDAIYSCGSAVYIPRPVDFFVK